MLLVSCAFQRIGRAVSVAENLPGWKTLKLRRHNAIPSLTWGAAWSPLTTSVIGELPRFPKQVSPEL